MPYSHRGQSRTESRRPLVWSILGMGLLGLLALTPAQATTYTVNDPGDGTDTSACITASGACTLRAAILAANAHAGQDQISINVSGITLSIPGANENSAATGDLDITEDLAINGIDPTDAASTTIDGNGTITNDRVFEVFNGVTLSVAGVTIKNGAVADAVGGGIRINSGATVTLDHVDISGNTATGTATGSPASGGGIDNAGTLTMSNSSIRNNIVLRGDSGGGGLHNTGIAKLTETLIDGNAGAPGGGGIGNVGPGSLPGEPVNSLILINCTVTNNSANEAGVGAGGGIRNLYGSVTVTGSMIAGNTSAGSGGGIENTGGGLLISRSTIRTNFAGQAGGGISNFDILDISQTLISENIASLGGGLYNNGVGAASLINSTINKNEASGTSSCQAYGASSPVAGTPPCQGGGGIYNQHDVIATNVTIFDNHAQATGTGNDVQFLYSTASGKAVVTVFTNSIIGNSTYTPVCGGDTPLITSNGNNLETTDTCHFTQSTDIVNANPQLDPSGLQFNPSDNINYPKTLALQAGSPAKDKGNSTPAVCPSMDQRGYARIDGHCDIGAYEISDTPFIGTVADMKIEITDNLLLVSNSYQLTYTVTVRNLGDQDATGVTADITLPANTTLVNPGSPTGGTCSSPSTGVVHCELGTIKTYTSTQFFILIVPQVTGVTMTATAKVHATSADPNPPNNVATVNTSVPSIPTGNGTGCGITNVCSTGGGGGSFAWTMVLLGLPALRRRRLH